MHHSKNGPIKKNTIKTFNKDQPLKYMSKNVPSSGNSSKNKYLPIKIEYEKKLQLEKVI